MQSSPYVQFWNHQPGPMEVPYVEQYHDAFERPSEVEYPPQYFEAQHVHNYLEDDIHNFSDFRDFHEWQPLYSQEFKTRNHEGYFPYGATHDHRTFVHQQAGTPRVHRKLVIRERILTMHPHRGAFDVVHPTTRRKLYTICREYINPLLPPTLYTRTPTGRPLYRLKRAPFSPRGARRLKCCTTNETVATLRRKHLMPTSRRNGGVVSVWRGEMDEGRPWMTVHPNCHATRFAIVDCETGCELAHIRKRIFTLGYLLRRKCTYVVWFAHSVLDDALMASIVSSLHDYYA